jgi:ATP-binding cassette subfamily F protein 3
MLRIDDISYAIAGNPLLEEAERDDSGGPQGGHRGAERRGQDDALPPDPGGADAGWRRDLPAAARADRRRRAGGAGDGGLASRHGAGGGRGTRGAPGRHVRDPDRIAEVQTRLADIDAWSGEARASAILKGLGFTAEEQRMPCSAFSGGWRMRVALAGVLFAQPDLLLLDEPTNYLDLEGALWLESYLARYPHTVLIISHDRGLLNRAVDHILHLEGRKLTLYSGGYDAFARARAERAPCRPPRRRSRRPSARICRPSSTGSGQGHQGETGAEPGQDAGADDADPHAGGCRADGVFLPRARGACRRPS